MDRPAIRSASYGGVLALASAWAIALPRASADSWGPPKAEHWSANRRFVLKVAWPDRAKGLALWEETEGGLKRRWQRGYVDRIWPPYRAYVTGDGRYVVLQDVYHNLGYGQVIVILGEGGKVLGSYELRDFLPPEEIAAAEVSVSSIWWSKHAWFSLIEDDRRFALVTQGGTVRCFDLPTGKMVDLTDEQRARIVGRVRSEAKEWIRSGEPGERIRGITLLGGLRLKDAVPIARGLLRDKTPTGIVSQAGRPNAEAYGVQAAAALALVRLLGREAIPLIEREMAEANWYMKGQLSEALEEARRAR